LVDSSNPVSLLDIGPTILDLFGMKNGSRDRHHGWSLFKGEMEDSFFNLFHANSAYDAKEKGSVIGIP
jgi:arylsulfatase A-like enzyme